MRRFVSFLYGFARMANDISTLLSFDPVKIARRLKNKLFGRTFVRKLWKFPF
jgi:hypothetical protein